MTEAKTTEACPKRAARRRRRVRAGLWTFAFINFFVVAGALMVVVVIDRTFTAPDWVRERISSRIETQLDGLSLDFGDISLVIGEGWRPRARLQDVQLSDADGRVVATLADARASLAMRPLLRGRVQPKSIALTGGSAILGRTTEGNFNLALDDPAAPVEEADDAGAMAYSIEGLFDRPAFAALVEVNLTDLTMRYEDAMADRAWTVDGGRVRLTRDGDALRAAASFALLTGRDTAAALEMNYDSRIGERAAEFGFIVTDVAAQDIASQSAALAWLDVLRAPISGALRGRLDDNGALGELNATLQIGKGVLQPTDGTRPIPFENARSYLSFDPAEQLLTFDELSVNSDWVSGQAAGRAYLKGGTGALEELLGQFTFRNLALNPTGTYPEPLTVDSAEADVRLRLDPFRLTLGQVYVKKDDSAISLKGHLQAEDLGWRLALDGGVDQITPERLVELWPAASAPKPRDWVRQNLSGGILRDTNFALRRAPEAKPDIYVDFRYNDVDIRFLKTMPPITGASGQANLVKGRLVTTASSGVIVPDEGGPVDVSGTSFIIPDVGIKPRAPGIARVAARGSVTSLMSLLNRPPLRVLRDTALPVDLAQGEVTATGTLALPLAKDVPVEEVEFHLQGQIRDVSSDVLVPGHTVRADQLQLSADQTQVRLSGPGTLSGLPVRVAWRQPIVSGGGPQPSELTGTVEVSPQLVETFQLGLPDGALSGQGEARFAMTLGTGGPPVIDVQSDLADVQLSVPEIGWSKSPGATGDLQMAIRLGETPRVDRFEVSAPGLSAQGDIRLRPGGEGLDRVVFDRLRSGNWLDASLQLVGRGAGRAPDVLVTAGRVDMRNAPTGRNATQSDPGGLSIALDRLQVTEDIILTGFKGDFRDAGGLTGSFVALVNGAAAISGDVVPQNGRSAFRIRSDDAGGVVRSARILNQARGGSFEMTLIPDRGPGSYRGALKIRETRVRDAPAFAALLNAVSLVGLIDELAGQGIYFATVDADFAIEADRVVVYESSAVGPSIGLSLDGIFDTNAKRMSFQGVVTPAYLINGVGSFLTRRGEGIIGLNYRLTGPASDPQVQVNPLSVLAPGMLREMFRSRPPQDPNAPQRERRPQSTRGGEDR